MKTNIKQAAACLKKKLAKLPGPEVSNRILRTATITENGTIMLDGKKIGRYNRETCIGWCSLAGYIRIKRKMRTAS